MLLSIIGCLRESLPYREITGILKYDNQVVSKRFRLGQLRQNLFSGQWVASAEIRLSRPIAEFPPNMPVLDVEIELLEGDPIRIRDIYQGLPKNAS